MKQIYTSGAHRSGRECLVVPHALHGGGSSVCAEPAVYINGDARGMDELHQRLYYG